MWALIWHPCFMSGPRRSGRVGPVQYFRFRGLGSASGFSLRISLLVLSFLSLGFAVWSVTTGELTRFVAGLAGFTLFLALSVAAQYVAERSGAVERDVRREEELRAEMAEWPRWKRNSFLVAGVVIGAGMIALRIWSEGFR
jgi:hypothetical protein